MPLIDLPLHELKNYNGTNPKPHNFDAYWNHALAEMEAIDPAVTFDPVPCPVPYAEYFDLWWTGIGGARIHAKLVRPKHQKGRGPALVKFHGYSMNAGDWQDSLHYVAAGFTVAAMDVRGQGGQSQDVGGTVGNTLNGHIIRGIEDAPEKLFYRHAFLDAAQLARIVMSMEGVDPERVGATGWSQGGGLTLACAALEPRIARLAPVYPFLCDYKRVWDMDLAKDAYDEIRTWFRRFDPLHAREEEIFTKLGYIDCQHLASRIEGKTLMVTGLSDTICPPSTQFAAYNKIGSPKEMMLFPDFGHEGLPGAPDRILEFFCEML